MKINDVFVLQMRSYITGVIEELPVSVQEHHVAMVKYSDTVHEEFLKDRFHSSEQIIRYIADHLKHVGGNTNTAGVLEWTGNYIAATR